MANYNQLKTRAQQVRDEQTIGGNTALRVGQLLMDMVDAESETVDNIVEMFTGTEDNPVIPTLPNPGLLHWLQSPIVALVSMGEDLDGDAGAVVQEGDLYYYNHSGYQIFVKGSGSLPGTGYKARQKVLYLNKYTGKLYEWTGADMSEIFLAGTGGGGGNVTIEENQNYIDITIDDNVPVIEVSTQSIVMSGDNKTATFTVSGHNLTAPIKINGGNAYFSKSPSSISPVGGIVEATTVTVTFGGDSDDTDDLIVSSVGAASKTVHVAYTAVAGPTILADSTLTIKAAAGQSNTGSLQVTGLNLTAGITASVSGTGFTVSASESGTYGNQASLPSSGGTLYVKFSPTGSTASTGTLTLASTGATSKTVALTGAVISLTVSESSLSFSTTAGTPATQTFTVRGANLTQDISISASGTGFSVSPTTIDKDVAGTAQTVTVTYNPSAAGTNTGTVTIQSSGLSETITLSGTAAEVPNFNDANNHKLEVGGICYGVIDDGNGGWTNNLAVYNRDFSTSAPTKKYTGEVIIPSTVNAQLDGVPTTFTVTTIKAHAFNSNTGMTKLVIPDTVTSAGAAFLYLASGNLKYISFGNGLKNSTSETTIPTSSSNGPVVRTGLTYLDLGTGIKRTNGMEFKMAETGTLVVRNPDGVVSISGNFAYSGSSLTPTNAGSLKVPSSLVQSYKDAPGWGTVNGGGWYLFDPDKISAIE